MDFIAQAEDPIIVPPIRRADGRRIPDHLAYSPLELLQYHIAHPPTTARSEPGATVIAVSFYTSTVRRGLGGSISSDAVPTPGTNYFTAGDCIIMCEEPSAEIVARAAYVFVLRPFTRTECVEEYLKLWRAVLNEQVYMYQPYETVAVWIQGVRYPYDGRM
jgi:hypothetical protein